MTEPRSNTITHLPYSTEHPLANHSIPCRAIFGKRHQSSYRQRFDSANSLREILQIVMIGVVCQMIMLRFLGILVAFVLGFTSVVALSLFAGSFGNMAKWRRKLFDATFRMSSRLALFFFGVWRLKRRYISKEQFHRIRERYSEVPREEEKELERIGFEAYHIVSNHVSIVDPLVHLVVFGTISIVCKESVKYVPFIGLGCQLIDCIFVGRDNVRNLETMKEREDNYHQQALNQDSSQGSLPTRLLIFPEGTTTSGNQIIRFHRGAFNSGNPIQPLLLKYPFKNFNMTWTNMNVINFLMHMFSQVYNQCEVFVLPMYVPNEEEKKNWKLYAYNVQRILVDIYNAHVEDGDDQIVASEELFFRYKKEDMSESDAALWQKPIDSEETIQTRWKRFRESTRDSITKKDFMLYDKALQTPFEEFQHAAEQSGLTSHNSSTRGYTTDSIAQN